MKGNAMKLRVAQMQMPVYEDKWKNIDKLSAALDKLDGEAPDLVCLGEMFCCPYETSAFPRYAEEEGGPVWQALSRLAAEHRAYLSAGTVPEREDGRVYNTAYVFDRAGRQIARHRKMHLFDIDVRGGQSFCESATLSPGNGVTVFDTEFGKMGLCVCFDIRFPELARLMVLRGAKLILVPAAFNFTTGPAHWELTFRARALDNQVWYVGTSDAFDETAGYQAWGHSIIASPWGEVVSQMDEKPGHAVYDIELSRVEEIRTQLPLLSARRTDLYTLEERG